jgi:hypothetical protein
VPIVLEVKVVEWPRIRKLLQGLGPWPVVGERPPSRRWFDFRLASGNHKSHFARPQPAHDIMERLHLTWGTNATAVAAEPTILEYRRQAN